MQETQKEAVSCAGKAEGGSVLRLTAWLSAALRPTPAAPPPSRAARPAPPPAGPVPDGRASAALAGPPVAASCCSWWWAARYGRTLSASEEVTPVPSTGPNTC